MFTKITEKDISKLNSNDEIFIIEDNLLKKETFLDVFIFPPSEKGLYILSKNKKYEFLRAFENIQIFIKGNK